MRDILLIVHFIGIAMFVGTPFCFMALGIMSSKMNEEDANKFMLNAFAMSKIASIGFALIIISGIGLILPLWDAFKSQAALHIKLSLVAIMIGLFSYMQMLMATAKKANGGPTMITISKVGSAMLITSLSIIIFAVFTFH